MFILKKIEKLVHDNREVNHSVVVSKRKKFLTSTEEWALIASICL